MVSDASDAYQVRRELETLMGRKVGEGGGQWQADGLQTSFYYSKGIFPRECFMSLHGKAGPAALSSLLKSLCLSALPMLNSSGAQT